MQHTRRQLLKTSGAAVGAGVLTGLAGCSSIPFIGGGGAGAYRSWLPAPGEISDSDHYGFAYIDYNKIQNNEDNFDEDFYENLENDPDTLGLDFEDMNNVISSDGFSVLNASFNKSDVVDALEDEDEGEYEQDGSQNNYDIFVPANSDEPFEAYGVSGSTVIQSRSVGGDDAVDVLESAIEVNNGNIDRYHQDSDAFNKLSNVTGGGTFVTGRTYEETDGDNPEGGQFENSVASGRSVTVNGGSSNVKSVVVFDSSDDVDTGDLEDWVDEQDTDGGAWEDVNNPNYNKNGNAGVVNASFDTDDLRSNNIYSF